MNFLPHFFRKKSKNKTPKTDLLSTPKTSQKEFAEDFKTFILEPILTPSALIDGGEDAPDPTVIDGEDLSFLDTLDAVTFSPVNLSGLTGASKETELNSVV